MRTEKISVRFCVELGFKALSSSGAKRPLFGARIKRILTNYLGLLVGLRPQN